MIQQLINISAGWYFIEDADAKLIFWDLRFGQIGLDLDTAPFLWSYDLFIDDTGIVTAKKNKTSYGDGGRLFSDLMLRIKGN